MMSQEPTNSAKPFPGAAAKGALRAIGALFEPGDVIEVRALNVGPTLNRSGVTYSGYFNFENRDAIASAVARLNGRAEGIYVILNRLNPALLARANNRLQVKPKYTTADGDIIRWRWLYIDADPVRPAGISATDAEHASALERAIQIRSFLTSRGWPEPIYSDSGNGGHLLYRLPELDLVHAGVLVKSCLKFLASRYSDTAVKVDESTANAARLCKLYGTLARKGDAMPDRPHRYAHIVDDPERPQTVSIECLQSLAVESGSAPPREASKATTSTSSRFNIDQWLMTSGLDIIKRAEAYEGGRRWILRSCPFNPAHEKPAIIELAGGALVYRCLHQSCEKYDWKAFRHFVDPTSPPAIAPGDRGSQAEDINDAIALITDLSQLPSVWRLETSLEWCVEEMIACGSITMICSESGTGKTWLGYYIAGCVAHGRHVLGRRVKRSRVLYLDGENPLYTVKQRLFDLGISETPDLIVWGGWNLSPPQGPQSQLIVEFARRHKPLIIFDSLIEFHHGSEQSSTETRAFMKWFRLLANLGATVIVLHHSGKAETARVYRGSSDIKAAVDTAYQLESIDKESNRLGQLSLRCFKGRLMPGQNFGLEFREQEGFVACEFGAPTKTIDEVIAEILQANPGSNQKQIVALGRARGCGKGQLEARLRTGPWKKESGPNNSIFYSLPVEEKEGEN